MARARGPSRRPAPTSRTPDLAARAAPWAGLLVLLAATALAYVPSLPGPFVLDDWGSIQANMRLRRPDALRVPSLAEMLSISRPVTELTFAADYRAAGLDPVRFHAVGLGLHLAATLLAYAFLASLLRRAGHARPRGVALVVAGLFALHPIQAEAVAYAAQRSEVLASLLYLLALALLDRSAAGRGAGRAAAAWTGGAIAWLLAMGAKSIAISASGRLRRRSGGGGARVGAGRPVPAAAGGEGLPPRRAPARARGLERLPPLPFVRGGSGRWRRLRGHAALRERLLPDPAAGPVALSPAPRLAALPRLRPILRAQPGSGRRGPPGRGRRAARSSRSRSGSGFGPSARRTPGRPERLAAFGILFWFVVLSPTSSFVPVNDLAVEHRVYLASLGPFLAVTVGADALLHRMLAGRRASAPAARARLAGPARAGARARLRARVWDSAEALWREAASSSPDNPGPGRTWPWNSSVGAIARGAETAYRPGLEGARASRAGSSAWPATTPRCSSTPVALPRRWRCWIGGSPYRRTTRLSGQTGRRRSACWDASRRPSRRRVAPPRRAPAIPSCATSSARHLP